MTGPASNWWRSNSPAMAGSVRADGRPRPLDRLQAPGRDRDHDLPVAAGSAGGLRRGETEADRRQDRDPRTLYGAVEQKQQSGDLSPEGSGEAVRQPVLAGNGAGGWH